jgi:hypothetical protein
MRRISKVLSHKNKEDDVMCMNNYCFWTLLIAALIVYCCGGCGCDR